MARIVALTLILLPVVLSAQNEWALQQWMEVEGIYNGQQLGRSVGFAGKVDDSTKITIGDVNGIRMIHVKSPGDTALRFFFPGDNCSLADFNGDGLKDLLVSGNPTKIYIGTSPGVFDTAAFFMKYQEPDGYAFGIRVATGKINGDLFDDLVITDAGYPNGDNVGRVYVFLGGEEMDTMAAKIFEGDTIRKTLGTKVAVGDLNSDGFDDIITRGYDSNPPTSQRYGYLRIFLGGDVLSVIPWKEIGGENNLDAISSFDVNGDGVDDLLWTDWNPADSLNVIKIHYGGAEIDTVASLILKDPGAGMGQVIANAEDMNGDGFNDILVGAPYASLDFGLVLIFGGGPLIDSKFDAAAGLSVQSLFGQSSLSIGDVNDDGLSDIVVGAPRFEWTEYRGKWFILLGDTNVPVTSVESPGETRFPSGFSLFSNYPNPFNSETTIVYRIENTSLVRLTVSNLLGQQLESLVMERQRPGEYQVVFKADKYPSGAYLYKLTAVDEKGTTWTETKRMTFIK